MAVNPSNQLVEDVAAQRERGDKIRNETDQYVRAGLMVEHAKDMVLEFVLEMGHADVLTAKRMARAALGRTGHDTLSLDDATGQGRR